MVALQGFATYLSLADAGVQSYLTRELAVARASGRSAHKTTWSALAVFSLISTAAAIVCYIAFLLLGRRLYGGLASDAGLQSAPILLLFAAMLSSGAVGIALGGWSSAVDGGNGRYARVQAAALARLILTAGGIIAAAGIGANVAIGLLTAAIGTALFDIARFSVVIRSVPKPWFGWTMRDSRRVMFSSRGSLLLNCATATQNGLQPVTAAILSSGSVSVAIPGRTLSNVARQLSTLLGNAVWVAIAARFARCSSPSERVRFWKQASLLLTCVQVCGVAAIMVFGPLFVPLWLPDKSPDILRLLPIYLLEQAALVIVMPSFVLLFATGRFASIGAINLTGALVAVAGTAISVFRYGPLGFAAANLAAAALVIVPAGLYAEGRLWKEDGGVRNSGLRMRVLLLLAAVLGVALFSWHRALGASWEVGLALASAVYSVRVLGLRLFRRDQRRLEME